VSFGQAAGAQVAQHTRQPSPPMQPLQLSAQPGVTVAPGAPQGSPMLGAMVSGGQVGTEAPPTQPSPPGVAGVPVEQRPLRVEDALTYLDEVKKQFGDQPQM